MNNLLSIKFNVVKLLILAGVLSAISVLVFAQSAYAAVDGQIVGSDAYARGNYVEIGQNSKGVFGASVPNLPAGYHTNATRSPNSIFGFISNPQDNNWATFDGDFFTPGGPEEGFGLKIGATTYGNNNSSDLNQIPGAITAADTGLRGGRFTGVIDWTGSVAGITADRTTTVTESGAFVLMETTLTNTTGSAINDVYWYHNVDPDNDQTINGGQYATNNSIVSQPGADNKALVIATQNPGQFGTEPDGSQVSLYADDARARVSHGDFGNRDAVLIYGASGCDVTGVLLSGDVGCSTTATDNAISLAFDVGTIAAGASVDLVYAYNLSADTTDLEAYYLLASQPDGDSDGLTDDQETGTYGTNPALFDTDGDGIGDGEEVALGTNPLSQDTDGDGVLDDDEVADGTDPTDPTDYTDTDGDGVPDVVEVAESTSPTDPTDYLDTDGGTVPDYVETVLLPNTGATATDENVAADDLSTDTDGDGFPDAVEAMAGSDPAVAGSVPVDTDGDGVPDVIETLEGTSPTDITDNTDTDGDGHPDYVETVAGSDPAVAADVPADTDGDGVPDAVETAAGTDPADNTSTPADTDGDGHPDYTEMAAGSDAAVAGSTPADADGDLVPDVVEVMAGTSTSDSLDYPEHDADLVPSYIESIDGTDAADVTDYTDTDAGTVPDYVEVTRLPNEGLSATDENVLSDDLSADTDGDGFPDAIEVMAGSDPALLWIVPADTDGDGVPDVIEVLDGTDPNVASSNIDTDGDGHPDYVELLAGSDPALAGSVPADADSDGVPDVIEIVDDTSSAFPANYKDTDGDLVPDYVEAIDGTNPTDPTDYLDTDSGSVSDYVETVLLPNIGSAATDENIAADDFSADTDGDGFPDAVEAMAGTDPTLALDIPSDNDGDGVPNIVELIEGTDPNDIDSNVDTDGDGHPDYVETVAGSDPAVAADVPADTDGDGVPDAVETAAGTDPADNTSTPADTDGDGHPDYTEMAAGSDAAVAGSTPADADGDLVPDVVEVMAGTSTSDSLDYPEHDADLVPSYIESIDGTDAADVTDYTDTDAGTVPDYVEVTRLPNEGLSATDPSDASDDVGNDTDGDGFPDDVEVLAGTDPNDAGSTPADTDGDGVPDVIEALDGTSPTDITDNIDTDGDGHPDYIESLAGSDPADAGSVPTDTDGDGVPDVVEIAGGSDEADPAVTTTDTDTDGFPDYLEMVAGSDPAVITSVPADTDGDGVPDAVETVVGTDPAGGADYTDTDGDGHPDYVEELGGGDATDLAVLPVDTDGDGVPDAAEVVQGTDPSDATDYMDSDGDGHPDYVENIGGGDANDPSVTPEDTDGDDVPDVIEKLEGTDPSDPNSVLDTDGDGSPDYAEIVDGTDPLVAGDVDLDHDGSLDSVDEDDDGDGVLDAVENAGINGGDANNDGVLDSKQNNVATVNNAATNAMSTLDTTGSATVCSIQTYTVMIESQLTKANDRFDFPVGLNGFTLECANPGDTASVKVFYDQQYDTSAWQFTKYNSVTGVYSPIVDVVTLTGTNIAGNTVSTASYEIVDGGSLDEDGLANGTIIDPAGPAIGVEGLSETGSSTFSSALFGLVIVSTSAMTIITSRVNTEQEA